eukprot:365535-Chlamydomonas_euryale.AAC.10
MKRVETGGGRQARRRLGVCRLAGHTALLCRRIVVVKLVVLHCHADVYCCQDGPAALLVPCPYSC